MPSRDKYPLRSGLRNRARDRNSEIGIDYLERGTGFEPATSTLGRYGTGFVDVRGEISESVDNRYSTCQTAGFVVRIVVTS